jgi:hypothetical protein
MKRAVPGGVGAIGHPTAHPENRTEAVRLAVGNG